MEIEDEGVKFEEINDWGIMERKALAAIEDLKIQWNYGEKRDKKKRINRKGGEMNGRYNERNYC